MQNNMPVVENISCILPQSNKLGGLFLGNVYGAQNAQILKQYGIRAVITASAQTNIQYNKEDIPFHLRIDAHDKVDYYIADHIDQCIDFIEKQRKITNVFVHCYAGVSRSSAIICAYLIWKYSWSLQKTLAFVKFKRIVAKPNEGFHNQLKQYQEQFFSKKLRQTAPQFGKKIQKEIKNDLTMSRSQKRPNSVLDTKVTNIPVQVIQKYQQTDIYNQDIITKFKSQDTLEPKRTIILPRPIYPSTPIYSTQVQQGQRVFHTNSHIQPPKIMPNVHQYSANNKFMNYYKSPDLIPHSPRMPIPFNLIQATTKPQIRPQQSNSIYYSKQIIDNNQQKSKTGSRCIVRPKDLPGYKNY